VVGGLALSAIPPFSGFFSKDEVLLFTGNRGGWHWALYVIGYISAFLTALYTFRMIFRAFHGEPSAEARELEQGHLHHAETHVNPGTGEEEDTDVGFPGPEHWIAERAWPMKVAMGTLAVGAVVGGFIQVPHVTELVDKFLKPSFEGSELFEQKAPDSLLVVGLVLSAVLGLAGIALAYRIWVQRPGIATSLRERLGTAYRISLNKWYWDELLDTVFVRPAAWCGRFAQQTFERVVVDGLLVGGATNVVRAGSAAVRGMQSGFLRYYAALLIAGLAAVGLYFLLVSS